MTPRAEVIGPEAHDDRLCEINLGGYLLYDGMPRDQRLRTPLKIQPERVPEGVVLYGPKITFDSNRKEIDLYTFAALASGAIRVHIPETSVTISHDKEGLCIVTTVSKAVSLLLHTFFETHNRNLFIYPSPAASEAFTLTVDGHPSLDDEPTQISGPVVFRTEYRPSKVWEKK